MKESKLYKGILATVVVVALGVPAIASADAKSDLKGVSVKVSYGDLNLQKEEGVATLYRRLKTASKEACDVRSLKIAGSIRRMADTQRCYRGALDAAVAKIDNDLLTEIHTS